MHFSLFRIFAHQIKTHNIYRIMKKMKFIALALTLLMGISFTSCLSSDDDSSSSTLYAFVTVHSYMGTAYFTDGNGVIYYPTSASLSSVESTYDFSTSSNTAYIYYTVDETSTSNTSTSKTVVLSYAISLDAKVEMPEAVGDTNDSTSTAPIISLASMTTSSELYMLDDQLVIGVNYYMSKLHYFTLVYYPEETTSSSTEIKLYLRHNSKSDTSTAYTSSTFVNAGYSPSLYFKAFDLSDILAYYSDQTGNSSVTINVETEEDTSSIDLASATTKNYTLTYSLDN